MTQKTLLGHLGGDVWGIVAEFILPYRRSDLIALLGVCKGMKVYVEHYLYHSVDLSGYGDKNTKGPRMMVMFSRQIKLHPTLASRVRWLRIPINYNVKTYRRHYKAAQLMLMNVVNLKILEVTITNPRYLFDGASDSNTSNAEDLAVLDRHVGKGRPFWTTQLVVQSGFQLHGLIGDFESGAIQHFCGTQPNLHSWIPEHYMNDSIIDTVKDSLLGGLRATEIGHTIGTEDIGNKVRKGLQRLWIRDPITSTFLKRLSVMPALTSLYMEPHIIETMGDLLAGIPLTIWNNLVRLILQANTVFSLEAIPTARSLQYLVVFEHSDSDGVHTQDTKSHQIALLFQRCSELRTVELPRERQWYNSHGEVKPLETRLLGEMSSTRFFARVPTYRDSFMNLDI